MSCRLCQANKQRLRCWKFRHGSSQHIDGNRSNHVDAFAQGDFLSEEMLRKVQRGRLCAPINRGKSVPGVCVIVSLTHGQWSCQKSI